MRSMLPRTQKRIRRTTIFTAGFIALLVGMVVGRDMPQLPILVLALVPMFLLFAWRKHSYAALTLAVLLGVVVGYARASSFSYVTQGYQLLYGRKVTLHVTANEDATYGKNSQLTFDGVDPVVISPISEQLAGRIKIAGMGENMVYRGDILEVTGSLRSTLGGRQGQMTFATIRKIGNKPDVANKIRERFGAGMQNALPEPAASFGLGILIGQRSTLPQDVSTQLSTVGLTHLVAVSGYNLTIIVVAIRKLMPKRSKYQSTVTALLLIGGFILITGMSASIVRAAAVSGLTLWAWYYGRTIKPLLLISCVAALTAFWNPLYLWGDLGWYLSFLAFFGVLVIAPLVTRKLYKEREPKLIQAVLIETVCAQIATLPLILYVFQQVSVISVISNVLVVPMVPLAMLLSVIAGVAGIFAPALAGWVSWPAEWLLTYMLDIAALLSRIPGALLHYSVPVGGLVGLYAAITLPVLAAWRKLADKRGIITDKNITN